jgi:hypothetical protein
MDKPADPEVAAARTADLATIPLLISSPNEAILQALIDNPDFDETHVLLLLRRSDLPGLLLEEIGKKKAWHGVYRIRVALASHPHMPRQAAMRLLRDLHLMDLVRISLLPTTAAELRRMAEERILIQLPQLPVGQRLTLARRCSGRVAGGIFAKGPVTASKLALENALLAEAQLLKALAQETVPPAAIAAVAHHSKWSCMLNVRLALIRHKHTPPDCILAFLPDIPRSNIQDLLDSAESPGTLREFLRQELIRRDNK